MMAMKLGGQPVSVCDNYHDTIYTFAFQLEYFDLTFQQLFRRRWVEGPSSPLPTDIASAAQW